MYAEPTLVFHEYLNKWISVYYNEIKNRMLLGALTRLQGLGAKNNLLQQEKNILNRTEGSSIRSV